MTKKKAVTYYCNCLTFLVIRLDFEPFGSFLALSLSFLRPYALFQEGSLSWCNTKSVTQLTNSHVV